MSPATPGTTLTEKPDTDNNGTIERRKRKIPAAIDRRDNPVPPPPIDPVSTDEQAFVKAMDQYKRENRRPFPTWSEVLEVLRSLGYRKVEDERELPGSPKPAPIVPPKG